MAARKTHQLQTSDGDKGGLRFEAIEPGHRNVCKERGQAEERAEPFCGA